MIVRNILDDPEMPFDFFNDYGDTIRWLIRIDRQDIAKRLRDRNPNLKESHGNQSANQRRSEPRQPKQR